MKTQKFYIQEHLHQENFHGGIGNVDIEKTLAKEGYQPIIFPFREDFSIKAKLFRLKFLFKSVFAIPKNSIVAFEFPLYAKAHEMLIQLLLVKGVRIICIIADINGLKDGDAHLLRTEIRKLKRFRFFVVHNNSMKRWISGIAPSSHSGTLEFFDFLTVPMITARKMSGPIVFAGNLEKSKFLEQLSSLPADHFHFNLYGPGITEKMIKQPNVIFKGIFAPYSMPSVVEGSFGLVWDGTAIDGPGGSLGDYMRYISHHKLSLYILSELPIIAPKFAASAELIMKYDIGFCVDRLDEIGPAISAISEDRYQQMKRNMKHLAQKISSGGCLLQALEELNSVIDPA